MGGGQAGTRADAAASGALVFAVLAGWRRIPSPSATASGSPNRLLCPDSVRHMSVISGLVELMIVYCGSLRRRLEFVADADSVGCSRRSARHKRTQHWSVGKGRTASENRRAHSCPAGASGLQTAHSGWHYRRDKISNHGAELLILQVVTSGRCWVRTNVGLADGFTDRSSRSVNMMSDLRLSDQTPAS